MDLQRILLPFEASSQDQIRHLKQAAVDNNIPAIEQLLQRPQDPDLENAIGWLALHSACSHGSTEAVHLLLEANADKEKTTPAGASPLFFALLRGHLEAVRLLLEASADKDKAADVGKTPLFTASQLGHLEVVRLLLTRTRPAIVAKLRCSWPRKKATWTSFACCWRPKLIRTRLLMMARHRCT